jgi:hypothetical protein
MFVTLAFHRGDVRNLWALWVFLESGIVLDLFLGTYGTLPFARSIAEPLLCIITAIYCRFRNWFLRL